MMYFEHRSGDDMTPQTLTFPFLHDIGADAANIQDFKQARHQAFEFLNANIVRMIKHTAVDRIQRKQFAADALATMVEIEGTTFDVNFALCATVFGWGRMRGSPPPPPRGAIIRNSASASSRP
jgi:hypothetical protein